MNYIKYDIYIDEEKTTWNIGFLVVKNTPVIQQSLYNFRQKFAKYNEIKFSWLSNSIINISKTWLNYFFNLKNDNYITFYRRKWDLKLNNKEEVISNFINELSIKLNTKNIVAILDFETNHKNINIENLVYKNTKIVRIFHFNSKAVDLLQLSDLLLWCSMKENWLLNESNYKKIEEKIKLKKDCSKWELKHFLWNYFFEKNKKFTNKIFLQ